MSPSEMTQDQKPDFTELALKFVGTSSLHDPINVRIESAIEALTKAHDLGVERSAKYLDDDRSLGSKFYPAQIRKLKLGKE